MELHRAIELFLNEKIATTAKSYRRPLMYLADWVGRSRPVDLVKPIDLLEYKQSFIDKQEWKPATIRKHIRTIKTLFNWCVKFELIEKSPAASLKEPVVATRISRAKAMTDAELAAALDIAKHKFNDRDYALILFVADTGCRAGGASNLRIDDLDLANKLAVVTEKGDKTRYVSYGDACHAALVKLVSKRSPNDGDYVFGSTRKPVGAQVKADNLSQAIRRLCLRAGIRSLGSHSLRHRKGHALADHEVSPDVAAEIMGHSDFRITQANYYPPAADRILKANAQFTVGYEEPEPERIERDEETGIIHFPKKKQG